MDLKIPQIKKTIKSFLLGESGKISKESLLKLGIVCLIAGSSQVKSVLAGHTNETVTYDDKPYLTTKYDVYAGGSDDAHCDAHIDETIDFKKFQVNSDIALVGSGDSDCHASTHANEHSSSWADDCSKKASIVGSDLQCDAVMHKNELKLLSEAETIKAEHAHELEDVAGSGAEESMHASDS